MESAEARDRLAIPLAGVLALAGVALLCYGGYGVLQGAGALVWFVPRLRSGGPLVASVAAPWAVGGVLLAAAGGWALRDAIGRRVPSRRWLGTFATGMVLAGAAGLVWWGWLPFALLGEDPVRFAEAGWFIHFQFASALIAALGYFAWSRRLPHAAERFGATVGRLTVVVVLLFGAVALWMREPVHDEGPAYEGKTAYEWAQACLVPGPESMTAYTTLSAMGDDGEAGWRWLFEHESGPGGSFASVWVVWLHRQRSSVGWYGGVFLDDGLGALGAHSLGRLATPSAATIAALRGGIRESWWGLPVRESHREAAIVALVGLAAHARPAFWELLAIAEAEVADYQPGTPNAWLIGDLGAVGVPAGDPRRGEALRRVRALYEPPRDPPVFEAARAVVQLDPVGEQGSAALTWLADRATAAGGWQPSAAGQLEELGPLAAPVAGRLAAALRPHLADLHLPYEFTERPAGAFHTRAVWSAILASGARAPVTSTVLAALQHADPGPRLAAAIGLLNGEVDYAVVREPLWAQLDATNVVLRTTGAWAIAVSEQVPDDRLDRLVRGVDWSSVAKLLPDLTHPQRERVMALLERALRSDDEESSRVAAAHYPEIHERASELRAEEMGEER